MDAPAFAQLERELSTLDGFGRRVRLGGDALKLSIVLLAVGMVGTAVVAIGAIEAVPDGSLQEVLLRLASGLDASGRQSAALLVIDWLPFAVLLTAVVLLVGELAGRKRMVRELFGDYRSSGRLARQRELGYLVPWDSEGAKCVLAAVSHPSLSDAEFAAAARQIIAGISASDRDALRWMNARLTRRQAGFFVNGVPADSFWPAAPRAILLTELRPKAVVLVIPPVSRKRARRRQLFELR